MKGHISFMYRMRSRLEQEPCTAIIIPIKWTLRVYKNLYIHMQVFGERVETIYQSVLFTASFP